MKHLLACVHAIGLVAHCLDVQQVLHVAETEDCDKADALASCSAMKRVRNPKLV